MSLIKSEECREVQHNVLTEMQKSLLVNAEHQEEHHNKLETKIDKIFSLIKSIEIGGAKRAEQVKGFGHSLSTHMTDEEKTMGLVFKGIAIFATGVIAALGFIFHTQNTILESVIRSQEHINYISDRVKKVEEVIYNKL